MSKIYCGSKKLRKNQKKGSVRECKSKGQLRRYGLEKISEEILKDLLNPKSKSKSKSINLDNALALIEPSESTLTKLLKGTTSLFSSKSRRPLPALTYIPKKEVKVITTKPEGKLVKFKPGKSIIESLDVSQDLGKISRKEVSMTQKFIHSVLEGAKITADYLMDTKSNPIQPAKIKDKRKQIDNISGLIEDKAMDKLLDIAKKPKMPKSEGMFGENSFLDASINIFNGVMKKLAKSGIELSKNYVNDIVNKSMKKMLNDPLSELHPKQMIEDIIMGTTSKFSDSKKKDIKRIEEKQLRVELAEGDKANIFKRLAKDIYKEALLQLGRRKNIYTITNDESIMLKDYIKNRLVSNYKKLSESTQYDIQDKIVNDIIEKIDEILN